LKKDTGKHRFEMKDYEYFFGGGYYHDEPSRTSVSIKRDALQNKLTNIGFTQNLSRDFDMPAEFRIPTSHWRAFCRASDFSDMLNEMLEELNMREPSQPIDTKVALDVFEFPDFVRDLILDFIFPMLPGLLAEELFQQRHRWKTHNEMFSDHMKISQSRNGKLYNMEPEDDSVFFVPRGKFQSFEDYWTGLTRHHQHSFMASIILAEDDIMKLHSFNYIYRDWTIDRFRIGFFEIIGIYDKRFYDPRFYDPFNKLKSEDYRNIIYEKIPVIYDAYRPWTNYIHGITPQPYQPAQWKEYLDRKFRKKRGTAKKPRIPNIIGTPLKIHFTSGPTLREAIHQDVSKDVKSMISEIVKPIISCLQASSKSWTNQLFADLVHDFVINGNRKAMWIGGLDGKGFSLEEDRVTCPLEKVCVKAPELDPIKTSRKIKWQRTKEDSQRKRRQKYQKDRKFRQKRVHLKVQASRL